ncbi:AMP-binding protein [Amycolatopsis sp. K13G38]|uniref:AMP-binding protein n=1 Tax=Amycolatopsis acididurans TaxID=2724524 RepID=A0ABX1J8M0_9PSEU|nr:AMP-binding protein [Amycolatopsis acididurans]NKQ56113.1 AMP-binding protein [Amycolatopsis acididurans]
MSPAELDHEARTPAALLRAQALRNPDGTFVITDRDRVSWQEMWERVGLIASGLADLGVVACDTVVLAMDNRIELLESWLAVASLGAIEVPLNPEMLGERLLYLLNHSRARVAVVDPSVAARIESLAPHLDHLERIVTVDTPLRSSSGGPTLGALRAGSRPLSEPYPADEAQVSAILYTSGSTGPPKGVIVPNGQHLANARQGAAAANLGADDVMYLCLPLHHNMAQGYGIMPALLTGCSVRLAAKFDRSAFWDEVRGCEATVWPFVGGLLALLADLPVSEDDKDNPLRVAYGVPVPKHLHRAFESRFGLTLVHGYGSTEATIPVWSDENSPPGAAGTVLPDYRVRVVDETDHCLPPGTVGEICVRPERPNTMFAGYFHDPQKTVAAWRNLWFHTGDHGCFDDAGNLWFRGRAGDAIRRFGEFVDAEEVEAAVLAHDAISQAACVGVPDAVAGEEVLVSVVPRPGVAVSPAELRRWLDQRLPRYARPRYISVDATIPLTPTGKVQRYKVRERGVPASAYDFLKKESVSH